MTIRFGDQIRLASRDRFRLKLLTSRDPGDIVSFDQLRALMQRHRSKVRGVSLTPNSCEQGVEPAGGG